MEEFHRPNIEEKLEAGLKKEKNSFLGFFIRKYRFTYLIILAILFLGFFSLVSLPREADPEVRIPIAVVTTIYPGATPTDVEELITNKIEEKVKNLEDLKNYTSRSGQGFSSVTVEFTAEADLKDSYQKLRDTVDETKPTLPPEAEDPAVTEIRMSDMPIVAYSLVSKTISLSDLKKYADVVQEDLEGIAGVSRAEIVGGLEREFQVIVNQTKLANFGLSLGQVVNSIARTNFNLPAGNIEIDGFKYNVRVKGKFEEAQALREVVVTTYNETPIYVKDVAEVKDSFKEKSTESRIGFPGTAAGDTVSVLVYKKTGGNIIKIAEKSEEIIADIETSGRFPAAITIEKTADNSWFIKDTLHTLGRSGLQTMILIVIILFVVLGLRGATITGLSVPIAFLMAFVALYIQGQTLNSMVLYSLVISLGLMVDNSIIIMEGINEYITRHNKTPLQAALLSVWNFKWAITAGTMTTVAAFFPMLLVSGILGEYFAYIPKTITATLLSSLFVALIVIPTLAGRYIKTKNGNGEENGVVGHTKKVGKRYQLCSNCLDKLKSRYVKLMRYLLYKRKRRRLTMATAWLLFLLAVAVPASGLMEVEMFSAMDFDTIWIGVELAPGNSLANTREMTAQAEKVIAEIPELKNYVTSLGTLMSMGMGGSSSGTHLATITVNLSPKEERKRKSYEIAAAVRPDIEAIQGAKVEVVEGSAGPPTGAPIEVRIFGDDLTKLADASKQIVNILEEIPGTLNVKDSMEDATGEFTFTIDKQQANYYGLDIVTVASTLRNAIYGTKASTVTLDGDDVDITVKYDKEKFTNVNDLENLLIFTPTGQNVPLKQIAKLELEPSLLNINHRDGQKIIRVSANLDPEANLQKILAEFETQKQGLNIPEGVSIDVGGEVEDIEQSYRETFLSMIVAVILIAFILVLQFNSFRQPFIILFALPLAVIGVIIGLNILRMPFSFTAFLGIVALAGIAVNDAIVLVDRVNKNLSAGMEKIEGIIEAGTARMQPIFLTSITTIAGIFPLLFASELWTGFSVTLIFGLIFSTVLTLVIVPVLYVSFTKKDRFVQKI